MLLKKLFRTHPGSPKIKAISVDGCVGAGKTTLLRHLASGAPRQYQDMVGAYYVDHNKKYLFVEEPLHLYQKNGLLKTCLDRSSGSEDIFQVSAMHLLHVHALNVLELAMTLGVNVILFERHI